jgi:hypothetical protein
MMDRIMAVIGICGGLLCAVADCLLDLKGADNKSLEKAVTLTASGKKCHIGGL